MKAKNCLNILFYQNFGHDERPIFWRMFTKILVIDRRDQFFGHELTNFLANVYQNFGHGLLKFWPLSFSES